MAMCALIAAADGSIDASERQKTAALIGSNDVLAVFPPDELRQKFDWYCDKLAEGLRVRQGRGGRDHRQAQEQARPGPRRDPDRHHHRRGGRHFDADERGAVRDACFAVGIAPAEFDL